MSLTQILLIFRARLPVILLTMLVTTLTTFAISMLLPKQYSTSAAVVVDVKSLDPVAGTILPGMLQPGYMSTQMDIINSTRVAERVVRMLGLERDEKLQQSWIKANEGKGDFVEWAASGLLRRLEAKPSRDSNVIQIGFNASDPSFAAAAANAFARAYVDIDLELKIEPARRYASWFEEQAGQARVKLEKSQRAQSAYQQQSGIVMNDERLDAENTRINELTSQLTALQGKIGESQSKRSSGSAGSTEEAMTSPVIAELKAQIARLDAKLQDDSGNLGVNHPQIQRQQAQLASLRGQLNREVGQVAASFDTGYRIGKGREEQLIAAIAAQKAKVLQLNKQRDEFTVMRRDVETAQRDYDLVTQRLAQARLESRSSQTNVSILNQASVPLAAAKPKVLLNTAAAAMVGALLGIGFALLLEMGNRRIRSVNDLALAVDVPVLATLASVRRIAGKPGRLRELLSYGGSPA